MTGFVSKLLFAKNYGFIRVDNKKECFFHRDDYKDDWNVLCDDFASGNADSILVEFEEKQTPKGPRAADVRRV